MIGLLGILVMLIASLTTYITYTFQYGLEKLEGFESGDLLLKLTNEEKAKLEILNNRDNFEYIGGDKIIVKLPTKINGELRIIGKNSQIELQPKDKTTKGIIKMSELSQSITDTPKLRENERGSRFIEFYGIDRNKKIWPPVKRISGATYKYTPRQTRTMIPNYPLDYFDGKTLPEMYSSLEQALYECDSNPYCLGVTENLIDKTYSLRGGSNYIQKGIKTPFKGNASNEASYGKIL
jgi:hypothetical protein